MWSWFVSLCHWYGGLVKYNEQVVNCIGVCFMVIFSQALLTNCNFLWLVALRFDPVECDLLWVTVGTLLGNVGTFSLPTFPV